MARREGRRAPAAQPPTARRLPPMHALTAFEAAARLGTFAQAADELCVTQSAISHRMRLLEEHLGAPMFVRVHKHVVLTPQGERFLIGVREAMRQLGAAAASLTGNGGGRLRITSSPALASRILIPHLRDFLHRHPDVQLDIDTSSRVVDLLEGTYDIALRFGTGPWPGLERELLLNESVIALASPEYAARHRGERSLAGVASATLIHSSAFDWRTWLRAFGETVPPSQTTGLTFQDVAAALDAAVHGLGVVLANRLTSLDPRSRGLLVPFVDEAVDQSRHYYAVYRTASPRIETIRTFLDWLRPCVRDATAQLAARRDQASTSTSNPP